MEIHPKLEKILKAEMSLGKLDISEPDLSLISNARALVISRKKKKSFAFNLFTDVISFFSMKVKLYQAALSTIVMGGLMYYFTEISTLDNRETSLTHATQNSSSVKSSTVLTSILTLVARD